MKNSMFNKCVSYLGKVILYNSLSKKMFISTNEKYMSLNNRGALVDVEIDEDTKAKLKKYNFIVDDYIDERKTRDVDYYKMIMNSELSFTLMPTYRCNFRCKYCYESYQNLTMSNEVENAVVLYIKKHLRNYTGLNIRWFGGEPMLEMALIERVSKECIHMCNILKRPYSASITTNGYLLDLDNFKKLLDCHVSVFQITIDGLPQLHNKYRVLADGSGTFEKIISNLKSIRDNITSQRFTIIIRTNCTSETIDQLDSYIRYMENEFSDDLRFTLLFKRVEDLGGERVNSLKDKMDFIHNELYDKLLSCDSAINYDSYVWSLNAAICYAGVKNDYVIAPDGKVMKCTVKLDSERNIIGKLCPDGNMDIDKHREAVWLMRNNNTACDMCTMSAKCKNSSCPAQSLAMEEFQCDFNSNDIEYQLKLILAGCGRASKFIEILE